MKMSQIGGLGGVEVEEVEVEVLLVPGRRLSNVYAVLMVGEMGRVV